MAYTTCWIYNVKLFHSPTHNRYLKRFFCVGLEIFQDPPWLMWTGIMWISFSKSKAKELIGIIQFIVHIYISLGINVFHP